MQNFSFLVHLDDTFAGGWLAGRPNLKIMLTSAQLGLAGAWAELGKNRNKLSLAVPSSGLDLA